MPPFIDQVHILVEDLDTIVGAVRDEQTALGIEGQAVRPHQVTGPSAVLSEIFNIFSISCIQDQSVAVLGRRRWAWPVTVSNENIAIRRSGTSHGLKEGVRSCL